MADLVSALREATAITGFVVVIMLLLEFVNVHSQGKWRDRLIRSRWGQYLVAALLGALPGCFGAFAVVSFYAHGTVSFGALVAAMFATAGDESFVMLAMVPREAILLHLLLLVLGVVTGLLVDRMVRSWSFVGGLCGTPLLHLPKQLSGRHDHAEQAVRNRRALPLRLGLAVTFAALCLGLIFGVVGPLVWNWARVTILVMAGGGLAIICTVDDHFLREHIWVHVMKQHVPRIFLWTTGALLVSDWVTTVAGEMPLTLSGQWLLLLAAGLLGLIPESGPHLVFVTLFAQGSVPFSVLLTSSIVQDGHGMLPLLGESRRAFFLVKGINLVAGLAAGAVLMTLGM